MSVLKRRLSSKASEACKGSKKVNRRKVVQDRKAKGSVRNGWSRTIPKARIMVVLYRLSGEEHVVRLTGTVRRGYACDPAPKSTPHPQSQEDEWRQNPLGIDAAIPEATLYFKRGGTRVPGSTDASQ